MEATEVLDFDKICRLCLEEKNSMLRIFAEKKRNNRTPLPIRIMSCTSLEIVQGDGLPCKICPRCLWDVNQAYAFREKCDAANVRLQKYLHAMKDNSSKTVLSVNGASKSVSLGYLDDHMSIMEEQALKRDEDEVILNCKYEPQSGFEEEDEKPISQLIKREMNHEPHLQSTETAVNNVGVKEPDPEDDVEAIEGETEDEDEDDEGDSSDLETEPLSALVETEMMEDEKEAATQHMPLPSATILNTSGTINVRRFLETEFGPGPINNSEYSRIKKKQKSAEEKADVKPGRYGRDGWEPFTVLDLKPRKKYAPREKNLISNNSTPIIEQDGTKSKFRACIHCGKVVLGKNMGIHVKIHVGNKSHLCDICGKSFLYKKTLETHKRVHSGERPCVCKICDKTFRSSSRLSDHMSTHTGRKPFICEICAVAFRIKGHLKKHLRVHSGEKPYICSFCEKAFSDAWNMKCHQRIHTGEKPPHACPVCGQCFLRRNKMEEHCKMTHGEEYVLPRKQTVVQRLKNDSIEMNDELKIIADHEREDMLRQEAERQLLASHFESQRQELAEQLGIPVSLPLPMIPLPVPAFPGNLPAGIFGLQ